MGGIGRSVSEISVSQAKVYLNVSTRPSLWVDRFLFNYFFSLFLGGSMKRKWRPSFSRVHGDKSCALKSN